MLQKNKYISFITNPYFQILIVYLITHFFLLILTGTFWDDMSYETKDLYQFKEIAMMTGRPEWKYIIPFAWSLPCYGYRWCVFFLYGINAVLYYKILLKCEFISKIDALFITLLFITFPNNDARCLLSNFSYALGKTLFFVSSYLFLIYKSTLKKSIVKNIIFRMIVLLLFYTSFILNSIIFFYFIIFIPVFYYKIKDFRKKNDNSLYLCKYIIRAVFQTIVENLDFLLLPFAFFLIKNHFYPVYGTYQEYNLVRLGSLIKAIPKTILVLPRLLIILVSNYLHLLIILVSNYLQFNDSVTKKMFVALGFCLISCFGFIKIRVRKQKNILKQFVFILIGLFILLCGVYPYMVVRSGIRLSVNGVGGRDSILVPIGGALFFYYYVCLIFENRVSLYLRNFVLILLIVCGCVHFNKMYLTYQNNYYKQLSYELAIKNNEYIKNNKVFVVINKSDDKLSTQRFYTLNWNAVHAFGEQDKFFMSGVSDINFFQDKSKLARYKNGLYGMSAFDVNNINIDGIIIYSSALSLKDTMLQKIREKTSGTNENIFDSGNLSVIPLNPNASLSIIDSYLNGEIHNDEDLLEYCKKKGIY